VDSETNEVHHGGNFQAMAVTNAMEKTRLALHHIGKLMFAQSAELVNPAMNRGLPPSLAATDPSLDYHGKGVDIATAAYVSEFSDARDAILSQYNADSTHSKGKPHHANKLSAVKRKRGDPNFSNQQKARRNKTMVTPLILPMLPHYLLLPRPQLLPMIPLGPKSEN
jgi:hypothetical protein